MGKDIKNIRTKNHMRKIEFERKKDKVECNFPIEDKL